MSLTPQQQFQKLIRESQDILILLPHYLNGDALTSAWALARLLEKQEKNATIAADMLFKHTDQYPFLTKPQKLVETLSGARDFIVSFNTKYNKIQAIRSEEEAQEYRIYVTPEHGSINPRDFSFIPAQFKFDLVVVLGSPDKESLGKLYEDNADIFYEVPVINIDHHAKNDNFGQLNVADINASSTAEVLAQLLSATHAEWMDEDIAECLLTGIISATESFQKKNTTPKALHIASWLMDQGANQQKIVQHLYKTQPLHLLKLWGRIMAELKWDETTKLIWAPVTPGDLAASHAQDDDLPSILEKIKTHYSTGSFFLILFQETPETIHGIMKAGSPEALTILATLWQEGEINDDTFIFPLHHAQMATAEQEIISKLAALLATK
ncbi:MAG: DHH family phosphoesterase [Candidatus Moranbacteria bacterium]|nr:DHH family phosphoesterase [Candidatus Moranbacteria bacterium]